LPDLSGGFSHTVKVFAGGFLVQAGELYRNPVNGRWSASYNPPRMEELLFAWKVAKHVKSNAIVVTRDRTTWEWSRSDEPRRFCQNCLGTSWGKAQGILASDGFSPSMTV